MHESAASRMPVLFVGHGSPMNAIEENEFSVAWHDMAACIPTPKAILCISAHWETEGTRITALPHPRTIHDFYGFPQELYQIRYPAPGFPELAETVRTLLGNASVELDTSWGLDHGAWAVLRRMYPAAEVPVVQLSLDRRCHPRVHYELARKLLPLRGRGVLIMGSGNIVHNLRMMQWDNAGPFPWASEFDLLAAELISAGEHDRLIDYPALGETARLAIPTGEHYLPLLTVLALQQPDEQINFFAEKVVYGSISMRSLRIG